MTILRIVPLAIALAGTAAAAQVPAGKLHHHVATPAVAQVETGCRAAPFHPAGKLRTYGRDPAAVRCTPTEIARADKPAGGIERGR